MSQTPNPVSSSLSWEEILRTNRIETRHIDWAINNIDSAPVVPYEFVYKDFSSKVYRPVSISVSGVGGVIGALLALKHTTTNELKSSFLIPTSGGGRLWGVFGDLSFTRL